MKKDTHLINIYLKIHNKKTLTMDDLRYLAKYSPECFEKTCQNVIYNFPAAKPVMEPSAPQKYLPALSKPQSAETQNIDYILSNLNLLDTRDYIYADIDAEQVKNLLGNLYMELLFPHNDTDTFFSGEPDEKRSLFDRRV